MKQSKLFYKTIKEDPKDEESLNAKFLIRASYIDKLTAGIYTFLPLGFRVLNKIETIIRQEMDNVGAEEILMPALHPKENWQKTGRWESMHDILFKLTSTQKNEFTLGPTHEEIVTPLAKKIITSYKDLPLTVYQIQNKFRNEARAKSGLLRGREFRMKDAYSFHVSSEDLENYYHKMALAYEKIWQRLGLGNLTFKTIASGGTFSKFSHEYQTLCKTGEDNIYLCEKCHLGINKEIIEEVKKCPECGNEDLKKHKAIEVGNIFMLNTKFSDAFNFNYLSEDGTQKIIYMGCYGIGPSRVMGTIAEIFNDDQGLLWPENVAPYKFHLINLIKDDNAQAEKIYRELLDKGEEIIFDDRLDKSAGEKLTEADLIGIPHRLVISSKTKGKIEYKHRQQNTVEILSLAEIINKIKK